MRYLRCTLFGMAHFECAAAGSGALAIKDGLDTAYVGWNPESDMGNIEIWEQNMPMLYIGRSIVPNSGGAGKYRGGCSFLSTWLVSKTDHLRLVTSEHSSRVFDNGGMCGGYPAPTCQKHRAVRNSNIFELAGKGAPLAHHTGTNPHRSELELRLEGEHVTVEGPYITAPHKTGDVFTHSYNGGGGYGDVLERDPVKTAWDVENGFLTKEAAEGVFGIVVIALVQGALLGGMFWVLSVPSAALWGMVTVLTSVLPLVGAAGVWVPGVIYLVANGRWPAAIVLAVWGAVVVSSSDNFLRPKLVGGRVGLSELVMFFALLGGLRLFGVLGIVLGPVLFAIAASIIDVLSASKTHEGLGDSQ